MIVSINTHHSMGFSRSPQTYLVIGLLNDLEAIEVTRLSAHSSLALCLKVLRGTRRAYQESLNKEFCVILILLKRRPQLSSGIPLQ